MFNHNAQVPTMSDAHRAVVTLRSIVASKGPAHLIEALNPRDTDRDGMVSGRRVLYYVIQDHRQGISCGYLP